MSDEDNRKATEQEEHDVEAHKRHFWGNDEGEGEKSEESDDDFEAHRRHFQKHRSV